MHNEREGDDWKRHAQNLGLTMFKLSWKNNSKQQRYSLNYLSKKLKMKKITKS